MSERVPPLSASARMSDANYPGVVRSISPRYRLVVSMDCKRYALQSVAQADDGVVWVPAGGGRPPASLPKLLARFGALVPGLAAAVAGLPDDPAQALPVFAASRGQLAADFSANDWSRDGYARVVAQDGSLRIAVTPCGSAYRLQWVARAYIGEASARWRCLCVSLALGPLWGYVSSSVFQPATGGKFASGADLRDRWDALIAGLPERAIDGEWAALPPWPVRQSQALRAT